MDPNQIPKPAANLTNPTFTPPEAWPSDQNLTSTPTTPDPLFQPEQSNPNPISPQSTTETFPTPTLPATETPSSSKKTNVFLRYSLIGLALILLGILIGVLAARFLPMSTTQEIPAPTPTATITTTSTPVISSTPTPTLTATPTLDSTANWKTYQNKEFLYSFQYPSNSNLNIGTKPITEVSYYEDGYPKNNNGVLVIGEGYRFVISSSYGSNSAKYNAQITLDASKQSSTCPSTSTISELSMATIAGVESYEYVEVNCGSSNFHHYFVSTGGKEYEIFLAWASNDPIQKTKYSQTINQILSTFKFVEPTPSIKLVCPTTEWVDCMPGPDMIKPQCDATFLAWAKANCPGFKGAAL